jgi:hypothetical protein
MPYLKRPDTISPQDWQHMSWHARSKTAPLEVDDSDLGLPPDVSQSPVGSKARHYHARHAAGASFAEIAAEAGVRAATVARTLREAAARGAIPDGNYRLAPPRPADAAYRDLLTIGLTPAEMARARGVQLSSVERALQRAEARAATAEAAHPQREAQDMQRHAVQVQTADGPDLSWAPRDHPEPGRWAADRAATWERIGVPAQAIETDTTQLGLWEPEVTTELEASL